MSFFQKHSIDQYFLERQCPYTKRRAIKMKPLYWIFGILAGAFLISLLFFDNAKPDPSFSKPISIYSSSVPSNIPTQENQGHSNWNSFGSMFQSSAITQARNSSRNRNANQVIRRSDNDPLGKTPTGTTIRATLVNRVSLSGGSSPLIAEVGDDSNDRSSFLTTGSRVHGNASFDETNQRVVVRFHTVVSADGEQKSIQATAMMPDGSSGISGNYHSAEPERQIGKVLSHFIGGLTDGMKNRTAPSFSGSAYEPGSIRNGILNGITLSAEDQARSFSDGLSQAKHSISIDPGTPFLIYLEKEFP